MFVNMVSFWCYGDPHMLHHPQNSNHPAALSIISSVNCGENKVITLSFGCLSNSYILQYDGKKNEASYTASCSFLNEMSDFSRLHTCVKRMMMLLKSFTVTLLWWIWGALSHHANVAVQKPSFFSGENSFYSITKKDFLYLTDLLIGGCKIPL